MDASWLKRALQYLGGIPDEYLVIDVETAGKDAKDNRTLLIEAGWCYVRNGKILDKNGIVLDWTNPELGIDQEWLRQTLEETETALQKKGFQTEFISYREMQKDGVDVVDALRKLHEICLQAQQEGLRIVGHNFWCSDARVMERHFFRRLMKGFRFKAQDVFDTGMFEKAIRLERSIPEDGFPLDKWYERLNAWQCKAKWSLSNCVEEYKLPLAASEQRHVHRAPFDCELNTRLVEAMRRRCLGEEGTCRPKAQGPRRVQTRRR
jgi:hypothetical protein